MKRKKATRSMKHTMVGLTLFLLATSAWAGTLRDNFDDGDFDGWRRATWGDLMDQSAQWFVEDGELVSTSKNVCALASSLTIGDNTWKNYEFSCQFKIEQTFPPSCTDWRAAIVVGARFDDTNFNGVDVHVAAPDNVWSVAGCEGAEQNNFFFPGSRDFTTEENRWYTVRIVVDEADNKMFIDNELICDFQRALPGGGVFIAARNCEAHFDNVVITGDEIPDMDVSETYDNVFFTDLSPGINMISLPLKPITPYTARSFAEELSATVVIKLDEAHQKFAGFTLDAPDDGFAIEGGKGYIVNVQKAKVIAFTGAAWTNQPPVEASPSLAQSDGVWAFVVSGRIDVEQVANLFHVTVRNTRTNVVATDIARSVSLGGKVGVFRRKRATYFAAAFADLTRKNVVEIGDQLEVTVRTDEFVSETFHYTVTPENIRQANLSITLKNVEIPRRSILLQNYPNPFNPETWIPYQIKEPADIVIRIYNANGILVRTLDLGQREAGFYLDRSRAAYWDGKNDSSEPVSSGLYFYQLQVGDFLATRRMVIVK